MTGPLADDRNRGMVADLMRMNAGECRQFLETVNEVLHLIRVDRRLSQAALAEGISGLLGHEVTQSRISRCESESKTGELNAKEFLAALRVLRCSVDEFCKWSAVLAEAGERDDKSMLDEMACERRRQHHGSLLECLRSQILCRVVGPGYVYNARHLCRCWQVGEDAVLNMLQALEVDGLVRCFDKTAIVTEHGPHYVKGVLTRRAALEKLIGDDLINRSERISVHRLQSIHAKMSNVTIVLPDDSANLAALDVEFHECVATLAGRSAWIPELGKLVREIIIGSPPSEQQIVDEVVEEHQQIIDAVISRRACQYRLAVRDHLRAAAERWHSRFVRELNKSAEQTTVATEAKYLREEQELVETIFRQTVAEISNVLSVV